MAKKQAQQETALEKFKGKLAARQDDLVAMLPPDVPAKRFMATVITAARQTPEILEATSRSVMSSITKSAQDGLLPDGREGVINVYRQQNKRTKAWEKIAVWNPMTHGIRKRAKSLEGVTVDAQVIYENDFFQWALGDAPVLKHEPAGLDAEGRGSMVGAYAIFRDRDGEIIHREVMSAAEVEAVRAQSKAPGSLMWSKFAGEGWRKSVIRRGFKAVPVSPEMEAIVDRDNELYDFSGDSGETFDDKPPASPSTAEVVQSQDAGNAPGPVVGTQPPAGEVEEARVTEEGEGEPGKGGEHEEEAEHAPDMEQFLASCKEAQGVLGDDKYRAVLRDFGLTSAKAVPDDADTMQNIVSALNAAAD